jgi:GH25 family lysozyme M1 (1,4-beta-N-acetylmuramidase)
MDIPVRNLPALLGALGVMATLGCGTGASPEAENVGSSSSAVTVCGKTTVKGMDVSHFDGNIDWASSKDAGIAFAMVKATESTNVTDPMFGTNWAGMKSAGIVRGAYHFFHADEDAVAQATFFMQTVGSLEPGDLPLVLDLETKNGQTEATVASRAATFLDTIKVATGKIPMVYVSPSFLTDYTPIGESTLWIANWGVACPNVPAPWSTYAFWQSSDNGTVPGVPSAAVDIDSFNGTLAELQALRAGAGDGGLKDAGPTANGDGGVVNAGGMDGSGDSNDRLGDASEPHVDPGAGGGCAASGVGRNPAYAPLAGLLLIALAALRRNRHVGDHEVF